MQLRGFTDLVLVLVRAVCCVEGGLKAKEKHRSAAFAQGDTLSCSPGIQNVRVVIELRGEKENEKWLNVKIQDSPYPRFSTLCVAP